MKKFLVVILLFFFSMLTNAQVTTSKIVKRILFHSHGISFQKFDNLNKRISAYPQYEQTKNSTGTLEFGLITDHDRLVTSVNFNVGSSFSGNRNKKSTNTRLYGLSADAGYNLSKNSGFSVYPFAGLGYENYKVKFNKDISSLPFDSVLQNVNVQQRTESLEFTNSFFVYRLGIGMGMTSKKHSQNSIGLQVGYAGSFIPGNWKINTSQILFNSPKDDLSKIFASIIIRYQLKSTNEQLKK